MSKHPLSASGRRSASRRSLPQDGTAAGTPSGRSSGPGRLIIAVYGIFAIAATARASFQIATKFSQAPEAYLLSAFAAVVYIAAAVALARPGRRAYWISLWAIAIELAGVVTVGLLSVFDRNAFPDDTVWSGFGQGYGYVPLLLPLVGLWWLYRNRPPRSVSPAADRP